MIDQAAERQGRSRSDFMLDASCREAEDVLLSETFFAVNADTFAKIEALLDKPLPPTDKLRRDAFIVGLDAPADSMCH